MTDYNYISVSLHGHFDNRLAVKFSSTAEGVDREWQSSLPDPDAIVRNFVSARECYVLWQNGFGHYFSVITQNPLDPRTGRVMVTVMVSAGASLTGRTLFALLGALKKTFLEDGVLEEEAVRRVLASVGVPSQPVMLNTWEVSRRPADARPMCYRTYLSTRELEDILAFPNQKEYDRYIYDIVITATASLRPGLSVDRITTGIRQQFSVICPEGVTASADTVAEGEHLTLMFAKDGFNTRKESITVGTPSPFYRTEGSALIVKHPEESGVGFTRRVRLNVKSAKGGAIHGYTLSVNDKPVNTMEPFVELTEADLIPDRKIVIRAASNNFHPLEVEIDPSTIRTETGIDLVMTPIEQGIILRLDFGEGRVFEQEISIEKNTPEYSQLHGGMFHGFRAQRQATEGGEVYKVDVRAAGKPVSPAFVNAARRDDSAASTPRVVAPVFENVSNDRPGRETIERPDIRKPDPDEPKAKKRKEKPAKDNNNPADPDDESSNGLNSRWLVIAAVALVIIIAAAVIFLPGWIGRSSAEKPVAEAVLPADSLLSDEPNHLADAPQEAAPAAAPAPAPEVVAVETADIAYLNANKKWVRDSLKSDSYRSLYDLIGQGDIVAVASHPYFANPGTATNDNALKMVNLIWKAKGSPNEQANIRKMKEIVGDKPSFDMWELYDKLAYSRPSADKENTEPRPGQPAEPQP